MHDTPDELAQAIGVKDWKKGECELIPGKTRRRSRVERDYPNLYKRFTAARPADGQASATAARALPGTPDRGGKLADLNGACDEGPGLAEHRHRHRRHRGHPALAPKPTAMWRSRPGRRCKRSPAATIPTWRSTAKTRRSASATSRRSRARSSARPTWSGWSEKVSYNAGYTNVHELIRGAR